MDNFNNPINRESLSQEQRTEQQPNGLGVHDIENIYRSRVGTCSFSVAVGKYGPMYQISQKNPKTGLWMNVRLGPGEISGLILELQKAKSVMSGEKNVNDVFRNQEYGF